MAVKNISQFYSCKRKRDYITWLAIILFVIVLIGQVYLVLFLPIRLKQQETLEYHVARQQLLLQMDEVRSLLRRLSPSGTLEKGEADMIRQTFDNLLLYAREHEDNMTLPQIVQVHHMTKMLRSAVLRCRAKKYYIRRENIDMPAFVTVLENELRQKEQL